MIRFKKVSILLIIALTFYTSFISGQEVTQVLSCGWKLEIEREIVKNHAQPEVWGSIASGRSTKSLLLDVSVPGYVHNDLLQWGVIRDPFYGDNEKHARWVADHEWRYTLTFDAGAVMKSERIELLFEGLDTYADVYLNGQKILVAGNQFISWSVDVTKLIRKRNNRLLVIFKPLQAIEDSLQRAYGLSLPGGNRVFTRKGQWQYGWDWAPALPSMGIWKPVKLIGRNSVRLTKVELRQSFDNHKLASLEAAFTIESDRDKHLGFTVAHPDIEPIDRWLSLKAGINEVSFPLFFKDSVRYWWPAGMGRQNLYEFDCIVFNKNRKVIAESKIRTGIRQVELIREPDKYGESFYFRINGLPVFAKGANWVPSDHFPNRFPREVLREDYNKMFDEVEFAGMNMLRVWGGGIYEDELFYNLCDERGIMVWQDFMFACAMYPGNEEMLENIKSEAVHQIKRLRHHPSLALWCGNNEVSEGWHRWGWPSDYSPEDSARIWEDYLKIFESLLPQTVEKLSPEVPYWPTSPSLGRGDPDHTNWGNSHYWGVWHDAEPFEMFREKVPRFMSEFGFQSYPDINTVRKFAPPEAMNPRSDVMLAHQKHPRGNQLIEEYMKEWYPEPADFEEYVYFSQLLQAEGMAIGILAHREAKPKCMGTLYWQLNDCWPAVSWSSVDYYGERKALHYKLKEVFAPAIATVKIEDSSIVITLICDEPGLEEVNLFFQVFDQTGNELYGAYMPMIPVSTQNNSIIKFIFPDSLYSPKSINDLLFRTKVTTNDFRMLSDHIIMPDKPKNLRLQKPAIQYIIEESPTGFLIKLHSNTYAYGVYIDVKNAPGELSQNFFHLMGGETKVITFTTDADVDELQIELRSLINP